MSDPREEAIVSDTKARNRGERARAIVNDAVFQDAFAAVRGQLRKLMETGSDEVTLKAKAAIGLLGDVQVWLERVMRDGEVAAQNIQFMEQQLKSEAAAAARRGRR